MSFHCSSVVPIRGSQARPDGPDKPPLNALQTVRIRAKKFRGHGRTVALYELAMKGEPLKRNRLRELGRAIDERVRRKRKGSKPSRMGLAGRLPSGVRHWFGCSPGAYHRAHRPSG